MQDDTQTQTNGAPAGQDSSTGNQGGSGQAQSRDTAALGGSVDADRSRDRGANGGDDSGAASGDDQDRSRQPSRASQRISHLTTERNGYRDRAESLEEENKRLRELLQDPIDAARVAAGVKLPDRSNQEAISTEDYKNDVVNAATQIADTIVRQRLGEILPEQNRRTTLAQARSRAHEEMSAALDPDSPDYIPEIDPNSDKWDPELDQDMAEDWKIRFNADPTYRFKNHAAKYLKRYHRGQTSTNNDAGSNTRSKGNAAIRQNNGGNKPRQVSQADIANMSASEYADYIRSQRQ